MTDYFSNRKNQEQTTYTPINKDTIISNWKNFAWAQWHSPDWEANNKPTRDDKYLREAILESLKPEDLGDLSVSIPEILANWKNEKWWQENIYKLIYIIDNMYVKKNVKAYNGIYANWLTRVVQFCNTYIAEKKLAETYGFIWNESEHTHIHSGVATDEEIKPDFIYAAPKVRETVELKVCESEQAITNCYFKRLAEDYENSKQHDFHGADAAIFCTKSSPSSLYSVPLDGNLESLVLVNPEKLDLGLIPTINGKIIDRKDNPAVPLCLLYGITPRWQKY